MPVIQMPRRSDGWFQQQLKDSDEVFQLADWLYAKATQNPRAELTDEHPVIRQRYVDLILAAIQTAREWQR
jgi:hypothetical protein